MSTFAQQPRLKARGGAAGAVAPPRPSAEVLDMCRRLVAATESAVKNLQVMFPMVVVREVEEGREGGKQEGEEGDKMEMESAQGKALMLESLGVPAVTGRRPSIVAEEEEEEEGVGEEEEEGDEESLEEGEIREETYTPKSRTPVASVRSRAGTPATLAAVSVAAAESAAVSVAAAESEELRSLVEEVGQQLVEGEEEDVRDDKKAEEKEVGSREDDVATTAGAGAAAVEAEAVPLNMEMTEEENEKEDEDEEDEEEAEGVGETAAAEAAAEGQALVVEVVAENEGGGEEEEEEEDTRPRDLDSPPSMSDLGLSHFTRRFIEAAKEEGKEGQDGNNKTMQGVGRNDASSSFMSASPASPVLPREKSFAAPTPAGGGAAPPGTPTISMPTAEGMREFPSPVFRTGVKLRHPPSEQHRRLSSSASGKAAYTHASGGSSTSSSSSSSCRSPALFEPQSVNKQGVRRSLHAPNLAPLFPSSSSSPLLESAARKQHHEEHHTSFASSSAATPAMHSPSLLHRHPTTAGATGKSSSSMGSSNINLSLAFLRGNGTAARSPSYSAASAAASARSDDPTPELASPATTPFRVLPPGGGEGGGGGGGGGEGGSEGGTPSTARCIRLLQFPPLSAGGTMRGGREGGRDGGRSNVGRKSMSRTPAGGAAAAAAGGEGAREGGEDVMMMGDDESFTANYPDLTNHSSSFVFSPNRIIGLGLDEDGKEGGREGGPRYYLRSAEKKARELAMAKTEEEEAARRAAAARALAAARRSPRLASLRKSPGSSALEVASSASTTTMPSSSPSVVASTVITHMSNTRKSPRIARMALEREDGSVRQGPGRGGLFASDVEAEAENGGRDGPLCRPIPEVGADEYAKTPSFIQMQVTREMLNGAIGAFNSYVGGRTGGRTGEMDALPLDRVTEVIAQGDAGKTVLLSLIHLKRVGISVTAQGQKAYKIWK